MNNMFGIGILLDYQDRASAGLLNTQRIFNQTKLDAEGLAQAVDANNQKFQQLAGMGVGMTMAGAGLKSAGSKVLGILGEGVEQYKDFETGLVQLQIITGAVGEEFDVLREKAIATGMATAFSPQEAVQGLAELTSAGLSSSSAMLALDDALDIVAISAGKISLADGAGLMASTLNKFNLDVSETQRIADMFTHISNLTNFQIEDLPAFINSLGDAPTKMQRPLEELLAMGGLLRNVGMRSAQAGMTVKGFGRQLVMITQQLERGKGLKVDAVEALGLDASTFWDTEGNMRSMIEVFEELALATAGMTQEKKATLMQRLFGDQAGGMISAIEGASKEFIKLDKATGDYIVTNKDGKASFDEIVGGLLSVEGKAADSREAILETIWGLEKLREGVSQTFMMLIGQSVVPVLAKFHKAVLFVMSALARFLDSHPKFAKVLGYGIGFTGLLLSVAGVLLVVGGGITLLIAGLGKLGGSLALMATKYLGLSASMLSGKNIMNALFLKMRPMILRMGALALTAGVVAMAWKHDFMGIKTTLLGFVSNVRHSFSEANRIVNLSARDMMMEVRKLDAKDDFFSGLTRKLIDLKMIWKGVTEAWKDNTLSHDTFVKLQELGLLPVIELVLDIKERAQALWRGFVEGFQWIGDVFGKVAKKIWEILGDIWDIIVKLAEALSPVWEGFGEIVKKSAKMSAEPWEALGNALGILVGLFVGAKLVALVGGFIGVIWGAVTAIGAFTLGVIANTIALLANPITWIVLGITALIVGIVLLVKHWDKVKEAVLGFVSSSVEWLKGMGEKIKEFFSPLTEFFSKLWEGIVNVVVGIWNGIVGFFKNIMLIVTGIFEIWWSVVSGVFKLGFLFIKTIWGGLVGVFKWIFEGVKTVITTIWDGIMTILRGAFEIVKGIWTPIAEFFNMLWEGIKEVAMFVWDSFLEGLRIVYEAVMTVWTPIAEFFSGLWSGIKEFAMMIWDNFLEGLRLIYEGVMAVWTPIKEWFSGLWNGVKETSTTIWNGILEFIEGIVDGVKTVWDTVTGFFSGIWDGIKATAKVFFDWLEEKFSWATKGIDTLKGIGSGIKSGASKIWQGAKGLVGASTGGYTEGEGVAKLHKNELIVNDKLTQQLRGFLNAVTGRDATEQESQPTTQIKVTQEMTPERKDIDSTVTNNYVKDIIRQQETREVEKEETKVQFEKGAIQITVEKGTEQDAERFANMIMDKIEKKKGIKNIRRYEPIKV